jgi:lactoylglutathione lyase
MLSSPDLPRAVAFYRDQLGFTQTYRFPLEGEPEYVGLSLDGAQLGIGADGDDGGPAPRYSMCVYAADCDAAVERLRAGGATVLSEPVDRPWGERMAEVADPDGNRIVIMATLPVAGPDGAAV